MGVYISNTAVLDQKSKYKLLTPYEKQNNDYILEINDITKKENFQHHYTARIISINQKSFLTDIEVLIKTPDMYKLKKGDRIQTKTKFYFFKDTESFSYKSYMNSKNIYASSHINSLHTIDYMPPNRLQLSALQLRESLLSVIYEIYPKNEAIFLGGILLGARESLSDEIKEDFNNSGLTHFIAVSGFNITILILFLTYVLKYFPKTIQIFGISIFILFFVLLVGDTAPVIRAAFMGLLGYVILISGRKGHSYSLISFTALIMILFSPLSLNYDVSFHLSFLAVLGIIFMQSFYKKVFAKAPEFLAIKEALVLTFSALTFTLPLMLFNFGQVSILSPLANISVTRTIPIAMLLGFISIIVYFVSPFFGEIIGYFTWVLLKFDMNMVELFGNFEHAVFVYDFGVYKNYFLTLYFMISIFVLLYIYAPKQKQETKK
ncbi:MAG: ComEC/Rec2 family competence protein [Candidatus Gracilibacteria bacterium]|nr:ComEC/Rec2 family competence protein [Candidatus Gracilibacteria bacterium]